MITKIVKLRAIQAVYSCYTKAISHRWSYVQRTIPGIRHLFIPLEEAIKEKLIPAIIGRKISDVERKIFAVPVRMGGMNILNPVETAETEYESSRYITENLAQVIGNQETDLTNYNENESLNTIKKVKLEKEEKQAMMNS